MLVVLYVLSTLFWPLDFIKSIKTKTFLNAKKLTTKTRNTWLKIHKLQEDNNKKKSSLRESYCPCLLRKERKDGDK